jgi:glycosyltransferase involved in cell wall biosynthesis
VRLLQTGRPVSELISVVVTCYNLERYIGAAIQSVLGQQDAGAFEVVAVDDCSTDASAGRIREFEKVRYVRQPQNGGVLQAMLAGVEAARGDIVCLLDGDDLWHPRKLAAMREAFADPGAAFATHDVAFIDSAGERLDIKSRPHAVLGQVPPATRGEIVRRGILEHRDYVWLGSAMCFRRSLVDWPAFEAFVETLPDPRNTYQDWPLAFWIAARPQVRLAYVDEVLFSYRLHGANYSGDASTPANAVRNFRRTRNTIAAMLAIARQQGCTSSASILDKHLAWVEGQVALYEGRRGAALRNYVLALGHLARRGILPHELVRLAAGVLLGPERLVRFVRHLRRGAW